mgnify:CR=1 FL=1
MSGEFPTVKLRDEAERAEDAEDLRALLRRYEQLYTNWQREFSRLLDESGLSYARLSECSGISRNTLRHWCVSGGAPRCRSSFIRLGFGFSMTPEQTSLLLTRYGGYPGLYPRELFDAACIYQLSRGGRRYDDALALCDRCAGQTQTPGPPEGTTRAAQALRRMTADREFEAFALSHADLFRDPHEKLREFLRVRLLACGCDPVSGKSLPVHSLFAQEGISVRYEKDVSLLMTRGVVPRRERLIALGVRLGLLPNELDELLHLAGMEPLCAKNRVECILIYVLQQLALCHPELEMDSAARLLLVSPEPAVRAQCRALIGQYTAAAYHSEPDEADAALDLMRGLLASLAPDEAGELLELL